MQRSELESDQLSIKLLPYFCARMNVLSRDNPHIAEMQPTLSVVQSVRVCVEKSHFDLFNLN